MRQGTRLSGVVATLVFLCACFGPGGASTGSAGVDAYSDLVRAVLQDPESVDFTQLRIAWVASQDYDPLYRERAEFAELMSALEGASMSEEPNLHSPCTSIPNRLFTDVAVHVLCANLATATGDGDQNRFHVAVAQGLLTSIGGIDGPVRGSREITVVSAYEQMEYLKRSPFRIVTAPAQDAAQAETVEVVDEEGQKVTLRFVRHPALTSHVRTP